MSKIGLHIHIGSRNGYGDFLRRLSDVGARPAVIKCVGEFGAAREAKEICGDTTLTVGRLAGFGWEGFDQLAETTPIDQIATVAARIFSDIYEPVVIANPWVDVWEPCNEWNAHWMWQAALYVALAPHFERHHRRLGMFACSTGNPPDEAYPAIALACKDLGIRGHYLTLHEYGGVGGISETLRGSEPYHALRHRLLYNYLFQHDALAECIITEAGQSGGSTFPGVEPFIEDFAWYDSELVKDDYVVGAAAWSLGGLNQWTGANIQDALPALADYIIAHPHEDEPPPPPPPPPDPGVSYVVIANLLPQDATLTEKHIVVDATHSAKETILQSADDAKRLVLPGKPGSKVKVWSPARWTQGDIAQYLNPAKVEVHEFTPEPPPPPPPPPAVPAIVGVHHRADGGQLRAVDIEAMRRAKLSGHKFFQNDVNDFSTIRGLGIPLANCVKRLDHPLESRPISFYINGSSGIYDVPIREAITVGVEWLEIFNEPNLAEGGLGVMWQTASGFAVFCMQLVSVIKSTYPKAKILAPAISPQPNTLAWWDAMQTNGVFLRCDGIAAHAYWYDRATMNADSHGRHYRGLLPYLGLNKKIYITEASNNQAIDSDTEKGNQYRDYSMSLEPQVAGVFYFCISSSNAGDGALFNSRRETWVRPGWLADRITEIPSIVGTRTL